MTSPRQMLSQLFCQLRITCHSGLFGPFIGHLFLDLSCPVFFHSQLAGERLALSRPHLVFTQSVNISLKPRRTQLALVDVHQTNSPLGLAVFSPGGRAQLSRWRCCCKWWRNYFVAGGEVWGITFTSSHEDAKKLGITPTGIIHIVRRLVLVGKLNGTPEKDICEVAKGK